MRGRGRTPTLALALFGAFAFCSCRKSETTESTPDLPVTSARPTENTDAPAKAERIELLSRIGACEVEHRGVLLDLGTEAAGARRRFSIEGPAEGNVVDREGATFERIQKREQIFDVWLDEPIARPTLSLRVHGGASRLLHLQIDDTRLGALRIPSDETRILTSSPSSAALGRGRHRVILRFTGAQAKSKAALAEVDWLRLSEPDERAPAYAAPTREGVVANVALDRIPKQSLVLRAPSSVKCWLRPGRDARLKVALGLWGAGSGVAELAVVRDGEKRVVLATKKVSGGDRATWSALSVDLADYAGSVIGLELSARETTRGGRVAFGDPIIVRREESTRSTPRARVVVVVVLASVDRRALPPWGPTGPLRTLGELARTAVAFGKHRAPSTLPAAAVATLLTGLPPRAHGLEDRSSRLAPELHTVSEIVKEASGRTGMFTGVPTTFAPFGFEQGWDAYETFSPVKDFGAAEAIHRAARFLDQEVNDDRTSPTFVLVHARGGHPPWDVTREEAQLLKPPEYAGAIDPRRGGIILGALRAHRGRGKRLLDDDWTRVRALAGQALLRQDAALGELTQTLKRKGVWDKTLLVVTSDVGPGDPPEYPYEPMGALSEDRLLLPLLVKFPEAGAASAAEPRQLAEATLREIASPSSVEDVTFTILAELGLKTSDPLTGTDLYGIAVGREPLVMRAATATLPGRYSTRLGQRILRGEIGKVPSLCAFDVDPACAADAFDHELIAARALWQATFSAEGAARRLTPGETSRRPVVLDPETSAALVVWGDQE